MEKKREQLNPADLWDLSTLYASDEVWKEDSGKLEKDIQSVEAFRGKLAGADAIRAYFDADTALSRRLNNIATYAMLRLSENTKDTKAQELMSAANRFIVQAMARTAFARPEILTLPEEKLREITDSEVLAPYRFLMQELVEEKPHVLSDREEALLGSFGEVLGSPKTIADTLMDADLTFEDAADSTGGKHPVTGANFILLEQSGDRKLRENAFRSFYRGYRSHINTFAAAYSGIVKAHTAEAQVRHYGSSREMALEQEHIPLGVYDSLISTVRQSLPLMARYVRLRKKLLKLPELHYFDVYTPLVPGLEAHWSYEEAQKMVLDAVAPLGGEYQEDVRHAFRDRWIDVYPNEGKRGGAFSSGTYDSNPFILMSYTGDYESVTTVAHEMGHSQHTLRSNRTQPPQYAEYTLFVAEVASTVNENLLVENLLSKTRDPKKRLFLLNQYMEGFKGTLFRQTMFAEFEKTAHEMAEQGQALTPKALNTLYGGLVRDYFGPDLVMDEEVSCEWARIPHFYRPFYVYKYATSYSAAIALSEKILNDGGSTVKDYLRFLSLGGSDVPLKELQTAGVDLSTPLPVQQALQKFARILDEAEMLSKSL